MDINLKDRAGPDFVDRGMEVPLSAVAPVTNEDGTPIAPNGSFIGIRDGQAELGFSRSVYEHSTTESVPSEVAGLEGSYNVTNDSRELAFGAAIGANGEPYAYAEATIARDEFVNISDDPDYVIPHAFAPQTHTEFSAYVNTNGDYNAHFELGREKQLSGLFSNVADGAHSYAEAVVGLDSGVGAYACANGEISIEKDGLGQVFGRASGCLTQEGTYVEARMGVRTERLGGIPLEAGVMASNIDEAPKPYVGISFSR